MSSSTVAFTGIPVKTVNPRVTNPDPFVNTYRVELEKATIRKQRFLQSRAQAKLVENQVQERYRAAMIANVEKELFRRKVSTLFVLNFGIDKYLLYRTYISRKSQPP